MSYALTALISFTLGVMFIEATIVYHGERDNRRRNDEANRRQAVREMRKGMAEMWGRR